MSYSHRNRIKTAIREAMARPRLVSGGTEEFAIKRLMVGFEQDTELFPLYDTYKRRLVKERREDMRKSGGYTREEIERLSKRPDYHVGSDGSGAVSSGWNPNKGYRGLMS